MRPLTFAMNVSLDGYVAGPGDDLSWSVPSDELFGFWSDRVAATGLALYGRRVWEAMSTHWPTADQQPGVTPEHLAYRERWLTMPKAVFSATLAPDAVGHGARLVTGDAVAEIARLRAADGEGHLDVLGATLAGSAVRAGLVDEYVLLTHPVVLGGGTPFFPALDRPVGLRLEETRTFPGGVVLTRYAADR